MSARESQVERDTVIVKADSEPDELADRKRAQGLLSAQFYLETSPVAHSPAQNQQLGNVGIGSANT